MKGEVQNNTKDRREKHLLINLISGLMFFNRVSYSDKVP